MNFKKTLAAVAASAIAVGAMATAAFADGVYGGNWEELATELGTAELQDATSADAWLDLFIGDKSALKEVGKDKAIIVYVSDVNENAYFKVAGNDSSGNWKESAKINAKVTTLEAYDAEAGTITVPYSEWGVYTSFAIQGGQGCKFWGIAFEDDTATIDAIKTLMAGDSAAEDTTAEDTEATEAPADDANTDDTAAAGDTTEEGASKGNSDTGVEGVAAIAGLAIVAAGAVIVAKKRG